MLHIGFGFGMLDVFESFTIAGPLFAFNRSSLLALVDATSFKIFKGYVDDVVYVRFYEAQTGFYGKIASVINSATFFGALDILINFLRNITACNACSSIS